MAWRIEFEPRAVKELSRLDKPAAKRIVALLRHRLSPLSDPRQLGEALHGKELGRFWKYRVGDYRIIADIRDGTICIVVIRIGHRRDMYR